MVREPGADLYLSPKNDSLWSGYYTSFNQDSSINLRFSIYSQIENKNPPLRDRHQVYQLKITPLKKNKLKLQYYKHGVEYNYRYLKGTYKNGYFHFNRFALLKPLFPIGWGPVKYFAKLGISKEGNLVYQQNSIGYFFLLFIPFGKDLRFTDAEFKKTELQYIQLTKKKD